MSHNEPIIVDRLSAALRHGYAIAVDYDGCGRGVFLHLLTVIALDSDRDLMDLRLRCSGCGRRVRGQLIAIDALRAGAPRPIFSRELGSSRSGAGTGQILTDRRAAPASDGQRRSRILGALGRLRGSPQLQRPQKANYRRS